MGQNGDKDLRSKDKRQDMYELRAFHGVLVYREVNDLLRKYQKMFSKFRKVTCRTKVIIVPPVE